MPVSWILLALLLVLVMGGYLYILFRRFFSLFPPLAHSRVRLWLPILPAAAIALLCADVFFQRFMVLVHFLVVALLVELLGLLMRRLRKHKIWDFLYNSSLLSLLICGIYLLYGFVNIHHVVNTTYTLESDKLSSPVKIAFISDLHMGTTMDVDELRTYCEQIEEQDVDMVLLGGDMVDESTTLTQLQGMAGAFGSIESRYGTYYVFGNHDSFSGDDEGPATDGAVVNRRALTQAFADSGITILEDSSVLLEGGIRLVGRADISYYQDRERASLDELLQGADPSEYIILIDHQPMEQANVAAKGVDLMLSGHTHGGQLWPGRLLNELMNSYDQVYGEKAVDGMTAIVSSGMGGWNYQFRTGSHSEIVYITIE